MQINSSTIYSIWPLLFLTVCFSLPWKALHEAHRTSWGIEAHSRCNLPFRLLRESWEVRQALLSRMNHTGKSKGFRSGLFEGQSSLLVNAAMWAWIHRWVILEPCEGAESCWKVQGASSKCSRAHGNSSPSKMSEMHCWLFNFSPEGMKTRETFSGCDGRPNHNRGWILASTYCLPRMHSYPKRGCFDGWRTAQRQISSRQRTPNWKACHLPWGSEGVDIFRPSFVYAWVWAHGASASCRGRSWGPP